jgi:hypothetical protein
LILDKLEEHTHVHQHGYLAIQVTLTS